MKRILSLLAMVFVPAAMAQDDSQSLYERGQELYSGITSCVLCHSEDGSGGVGPTIQYGPGPDLIHYQLNNNPQMGPLNTELAPTNDDLLALSVYIKTLGGTAIADVDVEAFRADLGKIRPVANQLDVPMTARDLAIGRYETFQSVLDDWTQKHKDGNIMKTYETRVTAEFEPGEQKFFPENNKVYFYQNTGITAAMFGPREPGREPALLPKVVVGDAETLEVIDHGDIPSRLRGDNHFTALTPDGKYVYITGGRTLNADGSGGSPGSGGFADLLRGAAMGMGPGGSGSPPPGGPPPGGPPPGAGGMGPGGPPPGFDPFASSLSSVLKVDALTLQPVKQFHPGGRVHHMQIFRDKYMLVDTFARDPEGLDVFLLDPETDEVIGGVRDEELGGITYTSFTDNKFIYILLQPSGYPGGSISGYQAGIALGRGQYVALRPFWVAKLDPDTWEVVGEYPYPGYRGDWIIIDDDENIYVPAGASSNVTKIDTKTGEVQWTQPSGIGPYGGSLNADGSELWVADKGETTNMFGRTITVFETQNGRHLETVFSAYQVDHVLLSPNGKEFWASSNAEGRIYVFDAGTRELIKKIDMPNRGDAHGLVWVHYDENGEARVVRDQGGFHNGVSPYTDTLLDY